MYGRSALGQMIMGPQMGAGGGVRGGGGYPMPPDTGPRMGGQKMAWLDQLANRSRDVNRAVEAPSAAPAGQRQQKVAQDDKGNFYYMGSDGQWKPTQVIHNPDTGAAFYWDNDARDYLPVQ